MFREPEEDAAEKAAAKLEQAAATRRSSIRRESTVRPGRYSSSRSLIDRIRESRRELSHEGEQRNNSLPPRQSRDADEIFDLEAELELLRSMRERHRTRILRSDRDSARRPNTDDTRTGPTLQNDIDIWQMNRLRAITGHPEMDDVNTYLDIEILPLDSNETVPQHLPRPVRESGLRFEVAATPQSETEQPRRTRFHDARPVRVSSPAPGRRAGAVGSPWSLTARQPGLDDLDDDESENAALTPGFAPAHGPFRFNAQSLEQRIRRSETNTPDGPLDTSPPDFLEAPYPPLRRVNHLSPRPLGMLGSQVDGLGDRLRSPSPTSDAHEEENWANLLTTVPPARSDFPGPLTSSPSDSRSSANQSSNESTQATTVATSFGEIGGDDTCDLDLPFGITEEDVREIRARHGRLRPDPSTAHSVALAQSMRSLRRQHARLTDRVSDLEVFRVILDRMQRREDVPDEFWAAVGLSSDVVQGSA